MLPIMFHGRFWWPPAAQDKLCKMTVRTPYIAPRPQVLYHGTTLMNAHAILRHGPAGKELYVTPSVRVAESFARKKLPWFGTPQQRTVAVLKLVPRTGVLTMAQPVLTKLYNGGISAQYPDTLHYDHADMGWNPQYQYQFLTPRGFRKFNVSLIDDMFGSSSHGAPNCFGPCC